MLDESNLILPNLMRSTKQEVIPLQRGSEPDIRISNRAGLDLWSLNSFVKKELVKKSSHGDKIFLSNWGVSRAITKSLFMRSKFRARYTLG
jgi:hypothetical protein